MTNVAPSVELTSHVDGDTVLEGQVVTLAGDVSDPDPGRGLEVAWTVDDALVCQDTEIKQGQALCELILTPGVHVVTLRAWDDQGASDTSTAVLTVLPTEPPAVAISTPTLGQSFYAGAIVPLAGLVSDTEDAFDDLIFTWSSTIDGTLVTGTADFDGNVTAETTLSEGEHILTLGVSDTMGKSASASVLVHVEPENTVPTCVLIGPSPGSLWDVAASIPLIATVDDEENASDELAVSFSSDLDGELGIAIIEDGIARFDAALSSGSHRVTVTVTDDAGSQCQDSLAIEVHAAPAVTITSPSDTDVIALGDLVYFTADVSDDRDDVQATTWTSDIDGHLSDDIDFETATLTRGVHTIELQVTDGGGLVTNEAISIVIDGPPTAPVVVLSPAIATTVNQISVNFSAASGDDEGPVSYGYVWSRDGIVVTGLDTYTISSYDTIKGEVWEVSVWAVDTIGQISNAGVAVITIDNSPPVVTSIQIGPANATANDNLTCTATTSDSDGDAVDVQWLWLVDGIPVADNDATLGASNIRPGTEVICQAVPSDGEAFGAAAEIIAYVARNTPPGPPVLSMDPTDPHAIEDITCTLVEASVDPEGDPVVYTFSWERDGVAIATQIDAPMASTIPGPYNAAPGQVFTCTATPSDPWSVGTPAQITATVQDAIAVDVSAFEHHTCGVTSAAEVWCVGHDSFDKVSDTPAGFFGSVAAGENHTCAIDLDGELVCWGREDFGLDAAPAGVYVQVGSGTNYSCALDMLGSVSCWGLDNGGCVNDAPAGTFTEIAVGQFTSCAVATDGGITCWGQTNQGQGNVPVGTFEHVAVHSNHVCAIRNTGTMACWGQSTYDKDQPPWPAFFTHVAVGHEGSCGIDFNGAILCWGLDNMGQTSPPAGSFAAISMGHNHACAITTDGATECWGFAQYDKTTPPPDAP